MIDFRWSDIPFWVVVFGIGTFYFKTNVIDNLVLQFIVIGTVFYWEWRIQND